VQVEVLQNWLGTLNLEEAQRRAEDSVLQLRLMRFAKRVAVGERYEEASRRFHLHGHFAQQREADGGNPGLFDDARDQSHGLIADGSDGDKQNGVNAVIPKLLRHLRRGLLDESSGRADRTHKAEMPVVERAKIAPLCKLATTVERKNQIPVLAGARALKRRAAVRNFQFPDADVSGNFPEAEVAPSDGRIKRRLRREVQPGGGNQRQLAFAERLAEPGAG